MGGIAVWITGLPGSGKSSIADTLKKRHPEFIILRMDEVRKIVTPKPTYSEIERDIVYRCLVLLATNLTEVGHSVIIDATGNLRKWRELARSVIGNFIEVYLKCDVAECIKREARRQDPRGAPRDIYKKSEFGWPVPGVNAPYEEPISPEIIIEAGSTSVEAAANIISDHIKKCFSESSRSNQQT